MCSYYNADKRETEQAVASMVGLCSIPGVAEILRKLVAGEISKEEADARLAPLLVRGYREEKGKEKKDD